MQLVIDVIEELKLILVASFGYKWNKQSACCMASIYRHIKRVHFGYSIYFQMKLTKTKQKLTFNSYNLFLDVIAQPAGLH